MQIQFDRMDSLYTGCHASNLAEITIVAMPKRNLRVTQMFGHHSSRWGLHFLCDRLFYVPLTALKRVYICPIARRADTLALWQRLT